MSTLPPVKEMERAVHASDASYDAIFFVAVRTTGIFCRPSCPARKPLPRNCAYFGTTQEALKEVVMLDAGDRVRIQSGGGGGFGDPRKRDRERVRTDVKRGYVSAQKAREVYGLED